MILNFVRLGVIFFISLRQEWHVKIKAKCHNFLVKVSQMTRVPQFENHCNTVPEIVHVNRIITIFWYYRSGCEDNQMLKILECANVWFLRFSDFKVEKIALNLQWIRIAHCRKLAQLNALSRLRFSLQIHCNSQLKLTLK